MGSAEGSVSTVGVQSLQPLPAVGSSGDITGTFPGCSEGEDIPVRQSNSQTTELTQLMPVTQIVNCVVEKQLC